MCFLEWVRSFMQLREALIAGPWTISIKAKAGFRALSHQHQRDLPSIRPAAEFVPSVTCWIIYMMWRINMSASGARLPWSWQQRLKSRASGFISLTQTSTNVPSQHRTNTSFRMYDHLLLVFRDFDYTSRNNGARASCLHQNPYPKSDISCAFACKIPLALISCTEWQAEKHCFFIATAPCFE